MSASTNLALDIVLEEFGPTCHSVAEALTVLGASTIPDIVKYVSSLPNYASVEANVTTRVSAPVDCNRNGSGRICILRKVQSVIRSIGEKNLIIALISIGRL